MLAHAMAKVLRGLGDDAEWLLGTSRPRRSRLPPVMAEEAVLTEADGGVLLITLNRPDARNAVNAALAEGVAAALDELDGDAELQVGILTGAGGLLRRHGPQGVRAGRERVRRGPRLRGHRPAPAAQAADRRDRGLRGRRRLGGRARLRPDRRGARRQLGIPEVKRCLVAAGGALLRLPRRIPYHVAMELALTGDPIDAERAASSGSSTASPSRARRSTPRSSSPP